MKNYEKYAEKIRGYDDKDFCKDFVKPYILESDNCNGLDCIRCSVLRTIWLMEEYEEPEEEPETDWSKVEVDTPILVRHRLDGEWEKRHFAKYENGDVYAWDNGRTSWTVANEIKWKYAKLAEVGEECEEPKVDWSKVEVDTPILVRDAKYRRWVKRYFAKYNNGTIFAWTIGCTSRDAHNMMTPWKYAKLAKNEE